MLTTTALCLNFDHDMMWLVHRSWDWWRLSEAKSRLRQARPFATSCAIVRHFRSPAKGTQGRNAGALALQVCNNHDVAYNHHPNPPVVRNHLPTAVASPSLSLTGDPSGDIHSSSTSASRRKRGISHRRPSARSSLARLPVGHQMPPE